MMGCRRRWRLKEESLKFEGGHPEPARGFENAVGAVRAVRELPQHPVVGALVSRGEIPGCHTGLVHWGMASDQDVQQRDSLTLSEAVARAARVGITTRVMTGYHWRDQAYLVAVEAPEAPWAVYLIRENGPGWERWRGGPASQSGPERWDHPVKVPQCREHFMLRLSHEDTFRDVPFCTAIVALIRAFGWNEAMMDRTAEPRVGYHDFRRALEDLGVGDDW